MASARKKGYNPQGMTLKKLEAENGNASEDSIKIKTSGKRKTPNAAGRAKELRVRPLLAAASVGQGISSNTATGKADPGRSMATQGWCQPRAANPPTKASCWQQPPAGFMSASRMLHMTLAAASRQTHTAALFKGQPRLRRTPDANGVQRGDAREEAHRTAGKDNPARG